jgi:hypothetical protein
MPVRYFQPLTVTGLGTTLVVLSNRLGPTRPFASFSNLKKTLDIYKVRHTMQPLCAFVHNVTAGQQPDPGMPSTSRSTWMRADGRGLVKFAFFWMDQAREDGYDSHKWYSRDSPAEMLQRSDSIV